MALIIAGAIFLITCLWCIFLALTNSASEAQLGMIPPSPIWPWFLAGTFISVFVASMHLMFANGAELPLVLTARQVRAATSHITGPTSEMLSNRAVHRAHTEAILEFNPQYDITAYELAQAMQFFIASMRHPPDDMEKAVASLPFNVRRHLQVK